MNTTAREPWRRREPPPPWAAKLVTGIALGVYWPISRLFAKRWSGLASRLMTRYLSQFPRDYRPTAHDVFICSYFKSGTNWTMQIALQIAHRGRADYEHIHDLVPWPDISARAGFAVPLDDDRPRRAAPTGLRVIKTHLRLDPVPYAPEARYLCVVRDPKDVFVSSYHFTKAMLMGPLMPSPQRWLASYLSPDTVLGSWAEHVACYWAVRDRPNVLFLTYESMRADLPGTVDKIAAFMGVELTPEERAQVIERSTFAHMKSIGHKFEPRGAPWASSAGAMMRKGASGASSELLSADEQRRIDDYWQAELRRLGCDFPYASAFAQAAPRSAV